MKVWIGNTGNRPADDVSVRVTPEGLEFVLPEATGAIAVYPDGQVELRRTRRLRIRADEMVVPILPKTHLEPDEGSEG